MACSFLQGTSICSSVGPSLVWISAPAESSLDCTGRSFLYHGLLQGLLWGIPAKAHETSPPPPSSLIEVLPLLHPLLSLPPGSGNFWPFLRNTYSQRCHQLSWGPQLHLAMDLLELPGSCWNQVIPGLSSKRLPCSTQHSNSLLLTTHYLHSTQKQ